MIRSYVRYHGARHMPHIIDKNSLIHGDIFQKNSPMKNLLQYFRKSERNESICRIVGLDRHLQEQSTSENSAQHTEENSDSGTSAIENIEEYAPEELNRDPGLPGDAPHVSQVSQLSIDKDDNSSRKE